MMCASSGLDQLLASKKIKKGESLIWHSADDKWQDGCLENWEMDKYREVMTHKRRYQKKGITYFLIKIRNRHEKAWHETIIGLYDPFKDWKLIYGLQCIV